MLFSATISQMDLPFVSFKIIRDAQFDNLALTCESAAQNICTFVDDKAFVSQIYANVSMVITTEQIAGVLSNKAPFGLCIAEHPRLLFFTLHNFLASQTGYIRPPSNTRIGENCSISPLASIADTNVVIKDGVTIEEFAVIRENSEIGENSVIRAGAVVGGIGFEFKRVPGHDILGVKHVGGTLIGANVEIRYHTCIDRALYPWDNTIICDQCKIDNLVYIAHAAKIQQKTMIAANVGIGGRVKIGANAWVGLGAVIRNGLRIGTGSRVNMGAVVTKDVPDGASVSGNFAIPHDDFIDEMRRAGREGSA